jgi:HEAT repeat protein
MASGGLRKVNRIKGEKFGPSDWFVSILFAAMFMIVIVFVANLVVDFLIPTKYVIEPVGKYLMWIALGVLIVYPFWEMLYLARRTSGAVTGFHKFIESKVVDKIRSRPLAYVVCVLILLLTYGGPILLLSLIPTVDLIRAFFLWIVIVPLVYLNYFAAASTASNIIRTSYTVMASNREFRGIKKFQSPTKNMTGLIKFAIALAPLIIAGIGLYTSIDGAVSGTNVGLKAGISGYLSLLTTVVFGVIGFFTRYWRRKSKTKLIDFVFCAYIIIAIMFNVLINFMAINYHQVESLFNVSNPLFGPALKDIMTFLEMPGATLPIIALQNTITVGYALVMIFRKNSEFQTNLRLDAVMGSYEKSANKQLARLTKEEKKLATSRGLSKPPKTPNEKAPDYVVLLKSIVLEPAYNRYGVDVNEATREKAKQILITAAQHVNEKTRKKILDYLQTHTIQKVPGRGKIKPSKAFLSPQAFAALGEIGKLDPAAVVDPLIIGLTEPDEQKRQLILRALGIVSGEEVTLKQILSSDEVKKALEEVKFDVKAAVIQSIVSMGMEVIEVKPILSALQVLLDDSISSNRPRSEYLVETIIEPMLKLATRDPSAIDFDRIVGLLDYAPSFAEPDTIEYILLSTLRTIAYLARHNTSKMPVDRVIQYATDDRAHVRCVAVEALGNFLLVADSPDIVSLLVKRMLEDPDQDVRSMATDGLAEFIIDRGNETEYVTIDGTSYTILDYVLQHVTDEREFVAVNASDALKALARQYPSDIHQRIEQDIAGKDETVIKNCVYVLGTLSDTIKKEVNLSLLYERLEDTSDDTRCEILAVLGVLGLVRADVEVAKVAAHLEKDRDENVRLYAAFALGKIGTLQPDPVTKVLIKRLHELDMTERSIEIELIYESLGAIGREHPYDEIIDELEEGLMGDTHPYVKDVVAKALSNVGCGLVIQIIRDKKNLKKEGKAEKERMTYLPGSIVLLLLEAVELKGIPDPVIETISDCIQDLMPYFLDVEPVSKKSNAMKFRHLNTLKAFLGQAYYSNFSKAVLEAMDRVSSLEAFRMFVVARDNDPAKASLKALAKEYTPDGERFYYQAKLFNSLDLDPFAIASFKIALELAPHEYFAPSCHEELGKLYAKTNKTQALAELELAANSYQFFEDIPGYKTCKQLVQEIEAQL